MNDNDAARIAAAINTLRPDWTTKQLRTLLADPRIAHRPRRDVAVALTWVACDPYTKGPYRVLEAGPWWQAAAADDTTTPTPPKAGDSGWCTVCGQPETGRLHPDDHEFTRRSEEHFDPHELIAAAKRDTPRGLTNPRRQG